MSRLAYLTRRVAGLVVTAWVMFTLTFIYVAVTPSADEMFASDQVPVAVSDPLLDQYVQWLGWFLTIWKTPVIEPILDHLSYTAAYLVPAMTVAIVVGVGVRVYTVGRESTRLDAYISAVTLVAVSIPVFLLALAMRTTLLGPFFEVFGTVRIYHRSSGSLAPPNLAAALWPMTAMGIFLVAIQLRYAGDVLKEYASDDFVKTARAKGASSWRVGRHIFRYAAIPLVTVFLTDMLGMVVLGVFMVEYIFGVPGIGELTIHAVFGKDLPLILSLTLLTVLIGIIANFAQDVAYLVFDPRVEFEG